MQHLIGYRRGTGAITWSASNLPTWLSLSGNVLSGTAPYSAAGTTVAFALRATDTVGAFATGSFQITVGRSSQPNGGTLPSWTVNRPYSTTLTAAGGTPPYQNWSVTSGSLPSGLTLNAASGAVSGTPTAAGTAHFMVAVTDSNNLALATNWILTINPAPGIPSQTLPPASPNSTYSYALNLTGGTAPFSCGATGSTVRA
ncbi:MAG: Ig domain-containing protein [Ignavibacteriota bacterium]